MSLIVPLAKLGSIAKELETQNRPPIVIRDTSVRLDNIWRIRPPTSVRLVTTVRRDLQLRFFVRVVTGRTCRNRVSVRNAYRGTTATGRTVPSPTTSCTRALKASTVRTEQGTVQNTVVRMGRMETGQNWLMRHNVCSARLDVTVLVSLDEMRILLSSVSIKE